MNTYQQREKFLSAIELHEKGGSYQAINILENLKDNYPYMLKSELLYYLGGIYNNSGESGKAIKTYKECLSLNSSKPNENQVESAKEIALTLYIKKQYKQSKTYAKMAVKFGNLESNITLGAIYFQENNYKKMELHLKKVLNSKNKLYKSLALSNLGELYFFQNKIPEAITCHQKATLEKHHEKSYYDSKKCLSDIYFTNEQHKDIKKAIELYFDYKVYSENNNDDKDDSKLKNSSLISMMQLGINKESEEVENKQAEEFLWHYSNLTAFKSMIESEKFWATHYKFMNDPTEYEHGCKVLKITEEKNIHQQFIIAFTDAEENLYHWKHYVRNESEGIAIKFNKEKLQNLFNNCKCESFKNNFAQCQYLSKEGKVDEFLFINNDDMKNNIIIQSVIAYDKNNKLSIEETLEKGLEAVKVKYDKLKASYIKSPHYESEKEWRILFYKEEEDKKNDAIYKPYAFKPRIEVEFELKEFIEAIDEIIIAPHANNGMVENHLEFLHHYFINKEKFNIKTTFKKTKEEDGWVSNSKIPFLG